MDFQHAIMATDLECTYPYTTDQEFKIFNLIPKFSTLTIITP